MQRLCRGMHNVYEKINLFDFCQSIIFDPCEISCDNVFFLDKKDRLSM